MSDVEKRQKRCLFDLRRAFQNERLVVEFPQDAVEMEDIHSFDYSRRDGFSITMTAPDVCTAWWDIDDVTVYGDQHIWQLYNPYINSDYEITTDEALEADIRVDWLTTEDPLWRKP